MARCRALVRRGTAFYELGEFVDALRDYEAALALDPKNQGLIKDANKIRKIIQGDDELWWMCVGVRCVVSTKGTIQKWTVSLPTGFGLCQG